MCIKRKKTKSHFLSLMAVSIKKYFKKYEETNKKGRTFSPQNSNLFQHYFKIPFFL